MKPIDISSYLSLLGYSIESTDLVSLLASNAFSTELPIAKLRKTGSHNIVDAKRGIELMFMERAQFASFYGEPASAGEGIFVSVAVHPIKNGEFAPFSGTIGGSLDGIGSHGEIGELLGRGNVEDEEDGTVLTESWNLQGRTLFVDYTQNGEIKSMQFSMPMRPDA